VEVTSFAHHTCPLARAFEQVGPWWNLLILRNVFLGMRRFADLESNLGITPTTLNRRLRQLCRDGILSRVRYNARPSRYEYRLTEKGVDLMPVVVALTAWGQRWLSPQGMALIAESVATGQEVEPVLMDAVSGERLLPGSIRLKAGPNADAALRRLLGTSPPFPVLED
jgi:DNA-binding HxlR family transcriptional regulator